MADKTVTFTYPEESHATIVESFARAYNYQENIPDPGDPDAVIPNPETKEQFAGRQVLSHVSNIVKDHTPDKDAVEAARVAAEAAVTAGVDTAMAAATVTFV